MTDYRADSWYWHVADNGNLFSSAIMEYVAEDAPAYLAFVAEGGVVTNIGTESELLDVLIDQAPGHVVTTASATIRRVAVSRLLDGLPYGLLILLRELQNQIRTNNGQGTISMAQFRTGILALIE